MTEAERRAAALHEQASAHSHDLRSVNRRRLWIATIITGTVVAAQIVGAVMSGSLALLADAGHMVSDLLGLVLALVAAGVAARPATERHTFGFRRAEVLGALANACLLIVVAVVVTWEAALRLVYGTTEVDAGPMLIVAVVGLVANVAALLVLTGGRRSSINVRGAYLEVLGDTIGSVAVIAAALVIRFTGFAAADMLASFAIAILIVPRAVSLLRDVMGVLSEQAPAGAGSEDVRTMLLQVDGVVSAHDIHVWELAPGDRVFSAHVVVRDSVADRVADGSLLDTLRASMAANFDVEHSTFQLEPQHHAECAEPSHA